MADVGVSTGYDVFIGRKDDLAFLDDMYSKGRFSTCAITGRRRIGKTTLLEEFCKDKDHMFFRFGRGSMERNLRHMEKIISMADGIEHEFSVLEYALDEIGRICSERRMVIVFDEYLFLSEIDVSVSSDFQHFVDTMKGTQTLVIFCGSSISDMESEFSDRSSPLYGRIQARRTIGPLSYRECAEFHLGMDETDSIRLYLTVGGIPLYHMMMDEPSYRECIARNFIGNGADFIYEAENMITSELFPQDRYIAIVEAVADGCTTHTEIVRRTGIPKSTCTRYLGNMELLGIIDRIRPMSMRSSTEAPYAIADNLVAFTYEVIEKHPELRSYGDPLGSYDAMYEEIASFLGKRFERLCSEFICRNYITMDIGKWWGRIDGEDTDIDIVARISDGRSKYDLYCECKFRRKESTYRDYEILKEKVSELNRRAGPANERYMLFSISGFSDSLIEAEENDPKLILVDPDVLVGRKLAKPM